MAPAKKGCEQKKGCSAINEGVTRGYTINIHKHIRGMDFKKCAPRVLKEIQKFAMKEMETPDVRIPGFLDTRLNKAVWAKGILGHSISNPCVVVQKTKRRRNSPNKPYTLVPYVPVTTLKNLQSMCMRTNC
ncbi:60S ribosomal protein L31 [Tupaia chinensis]|uniref:Large ribosomal subunit protein eL31 n=1 Tax=Tupaia chinensis TaxID=246437 RepID=L9KPJ5_TUPCH|nr:60S ribosomal protein L31 [Tupaia chinensis]